MPVSYISTRGLGWAAIFVFLLLDMVWPFLSNKEMSFSQYLVLGNTFFVCNL